MKTKTKVHPAADAFPMMDSDAFASLKADIEQYGQREPIIYWKGQLIDGRNRLKACEELSIEPTESEIDSSEDPVAYVLSANLHRRHLDTGQRAMIAAKLATLKRGGDRGNQHTGGKASNEGLPVTEAAKMLSVGKASVERAKFTLQGGCKELIAAVESGEVTVALAQKLVVAVRDKAKQAAIVAKGVAAIQEAIKPKPESQTSQRNGAGSTATVAAKKEFPLSDRLLKGIADVGSVRHIIYEQLGGLQKAMKSDGWDSSQDNFIRQQIHGLKLVADELQGDIEQCVKRKSRTSPSK